MHANLNRTKINSSIFYPDTFKLDGLYDIGSTTGVVMDILVLQEVFFWKTVAVSVNDAEAGIVYQRYLYFLHWTSMNRIRYTP